jgi:hypothetical protein
MGFRHSDTDTSALVRGPRLYLTARDNKRCLVCLVGRPGGINEALFYRSSVLGANSSLISNFFDVSPCS